MGWLAGVVDDVPREKVAWDVTFCGVQRAPRRFDFYRALARGVERGGDAAARQHDDRRGADAGGKSASSDILDNTIRISSYQHSGIALGIAKQPIPVGRIGEAVADKVGEHRTVDFRLVGHAYPGRGI